MPFFFLFFLPFLFGRPTKRSGDVTTHHQLASAAKWLAMTCLCAHTRALQATRRSVSMTYNYIEWVDHQKSSNTSSSFRPCWSPLYPTGWVGWLLVLPYIYNRPCLRGSPIYISTYKATGGGPTSHQRIFLPFFFGRVSSSLPLIVSPRPIPTFDAQPPPKGYKTVSDVPDSTLTIGIIKLSRKASAEFIPSMVAGTISGYPKKKKILFLSSQQLWTRIRKKKWKSMEWKKNAGGDELCVNVNAESLIIRLSLVKIVKCDVWWRSFFRIWTISRRTHTHTHSTWAPRPAPEKKKTYFAAAAGRH